MHFSHLEAVCKLRLNIVQSLSYKTDTGSADASTVPLPCPGCPCFQTALWSAPQILLLCFQFLLFMFCLEKLFKICGGGNRFSIFHCLCYYHAVKQLYFFVVVQ